MNLRKIGPCSGRTDPMNSQKTDQNERKIAQNASAVWRFDQSRG
jgi:hypothetical protein